MNFHWVQGLWSITCLMKDTWNQFYVDFVFKRGCILFHLNFPRPKNAGVRKSGTPEIIQDWSGNLGNQLGHWG